MARVVMLLAHGPGQPEGDLSYRLEVSAVLTPQGMLDEAGFGAEPWPERCGCCLTGARLPASWCAPMPVGRCAAPPVRMRRCGISSGG